jgi:RND family efflux transporter MFP subunit
MVAAVCAAAAAPGTNAQSMPPTPVRAAAARLEVVQEHRLVTGELRAVRQSRVAAEEPGLVLESRTETGQRVQRGEVIAVLDGHRLELALAEFAAAQAAAEATLEERRTEAAWRELDLATYQRVAEQGAGNPKELYDAESSLRIARAKATEAERQVAVIAARQSLLRRRLEDMTITAPFDGAVIARHAEPGEWLGEGDAVVDLLSTGAVDAWLDVPQHLAGSIIGTAPMVTIIVDATGERMETADVRIIPQVDPRARSFAIAARLANDRGTLIPGMSISGWVPSGEQAERLTVPKDAVLRTPAAAQEPLRTIGGGRSGPAAREAAGGASGGGASGGGAYVYVIRQLAPQEPPVAVRADVEVLFSIRDRCVVRSSAIRAGEQVVTEGNERLIPMTPVSVIPAAGPEAVAPVTDERSPRSTPISGLGESGPAGSGG